MDGEKSLRQAIAVQKKLVDDFKVAKDVVALAGAYTTLGEYLESHGRAAEAESCYRQALTLYDNLPPHTGPYGTPGRQPGGNHVGNNGSLG